MIALNRTAQKLLTRFRKLGDDAEFGAIRFEVSDVLSTGGMSAKFVVLLASTDSISQLLTTTT